MSRGSIILWIRKEKPRSLTQLLVRRALRPAPFKYDLSPSSFSPRPRLLTRIQITVVYSTYVNLYCTTVLLYGSTE